MILRRGTQPSMMSCASAGRVTLQLLSFLAIAASTALATNPSQGAAVSTPPILSPLLPEIPEPAEHTFTLRHIYHHGTYRHPGLHRKRDIIQPEAQIWLTEPGEVYTEQDRITSLKARSRAEKIERLVDRRPVVVDPLVAEARQQGYVLASSPSAWTIDDVPGPNIKDKETVLSMALIAANAYVEKRGQPDWEEVGSGFNRSADFGWESDGLRGHIWADERNSTVVIGLKGTSTAVFDGEGTTTNDKVNDNLFFSCCCGQQGQWTWHEVCDCATSTYHCNNTCVVQALREENRYYQAARELYTNVTELYPDSNIWLTGHSLGGAVTSLLGLTYGIPAVTFEAVPEALAAGRLGLPIPPSGDPNYPQSREFTGAYHFGHTADPVYIGTCNGATASCSFAGYAMESACHTGQECVYDTVEDKGWRVGIGTHRIKSVINDVIRKYDDVPECKFTPECRDCANWKMYESNSTDGTTSSSTTTTTKTRTRTETCKTPGWFGCEDETTTEHPSTTTSKTTTTTSTCKTPGWFGCKDETTTTTASSTGPTLTTSTTCLTTGWFGCKKESTTTMKITPTPTPTSKDCETPGLFFGCKDKSAKTSTLSHPITSPPPMPTSTPSSISTSTEPPKSTAHCEERNWFGRCKKWDDLFKEDEL